MGSNTLDNFEVAAGRDKVASEHIIVERSVDFLEPGGRFGLVLPDGMFNNQGELSNCPRIRTFLAKTGHIDAIVSLPDFAFRKSGAQNKTSILFFKKFTRPQKIAFDRALDEAIEELASLSYESIEAGGSALPCDENTAIALVYSRPPFNTLRVFLAEANHIGYTPAGVFSPENDLYRGAPGGRIDLDQTGTILGEWRRFQADSSGYAGRESPDCMSLTFGEMFSAHGSHRIDPKYHLFKLNEAAFTPPGWIRVRVGEAMRRREEAISPEDRPDHTFKVMTLGQNGEIRQRSAGKGRNPPEWLGMYFENGSSSWFQARAGDVVYSSIDLWKGCIAVVPAEFDEAIVTKEFPIFEVIDDRLDAEFLSYMLRCRFYQRAFRAITTGHSNRRRTQIGDFEGLEICFPEDREEQRRIVASIRDAREMQRSAQTRIRDEMLTFSDLVDGRHDGELPSVDDSPLDDDE